MPINLRIVPIDLIFLLAGLILFFIKVAVLRTEGLEVIAASILIGYLVILFMRFSASRVVAIFILFALSYPVVFVASKYLDLPYHYLVSFQAPGLEATLFASAILFFSAMFFGVAATDAKMPERIEIRSSSLFYFSFGASMGLLVLGLAAAWPPVLSAYSVESRSSSLFEYAIIPGVMALLTARGRKQEMLFLMLVLAGLIIPLLFARRGVSVIFFVMLCFRYLQNVRNPLTLVIGLVIAFLAYRFFAIWRADLEINAMTLLGTHAALGLSNHQGGVIVSAVTYLGLIEEGLWDGMFRLRSFLGLFLTPYVPLSANPFPEVFLHLEALKVASIPGSGGFPFIFLYVWGSVFFVITGGMLMRWLWFNNYTNPELVYAKVLMLVTFPRWYAYSLPVGIKLLTLGVIFAIIVFAFRRRIVR